MGDSQRPRTRHPRRCGGYPVDDALNLPGSAGETGNETWLDTRKGIRTWLGPGIWGFLAPTVACLEGCATIAFRVYLYQSAREV